MRKVPNNANAKIYFAEITYEVFEVFTAETMKNAVFWDMALCASCKNRRFGGTRLLLLQGRRNP
jgi:hypothetical protein